VQLVSKLTDRDPAEICRKAGIPLLLAPSIKAGLDIDWSDPKQKAMAVDVVERQVSSLQRWVDRHLDDVVSEPLRPYIEALEQVRAQDLEVSPDGTTRIRRASRPTGASRSATARCVMGVRAAPNASMATRSTSHVTWTFRRSLLRRDARESARGAGGRAHRRGHQEPAASPRRAAHRSCLRK